MDLVTIIFLPCAYGNGTYFEISALIFHFKISVVLVVAVVVVVVVVLLVVPMMVELAFRSRHCYFACLHALVMLELSEGFRRFRFPCLHK